jgi:hypothetical protein
MVTQAAFDRAMAEIYAKIEELRTDTVDRFAQEKELLEHRLKAEADVTRMQAEKDRAELLQGVCQQIKVTQDINLASQLNLQAQLANLIARFDKAGQFPSRTASPSLGTGTASSSHSVPPQPVSTFKNAAPLDKGPQSELDSEFIRRETRVVLPRADCPGFNGDNSVEWMRKCNSFFDMHQVPIPYRTHLATMQFHDVASEWYDWYLLDHEPPD